ncbi:hypothetical protein D1007_27831 [Hordeum vulgare]|nr:hypothetical protein D1007_27831 [Hordeum vulgare]
MDKADKYATADSAVDKPVQPPATTKTTGDNRGGKNNKRKADQLDPRTRSKHVANVEEEQLVVQAGAQWQRTGKNTCQAKLTFEQIHDTSCKMHTGAKPATYTLPQCTFLLRLARGEGLPAPPGAPPRGVTPSVALLRHFISLELVSKQQCSGCASLKAVDALAPRALNAMLLPEAEGFRRQWVPVEAAEAGALFRAPSTRATSNQGWAHWVLSDSRFMPVLTRLDELKRAGVTMVMVVRDFICRRIAPLQHPLPPDVVLQGAWDTMRI